MTTTGSSATRPVYRLLRPTHVACPRGLFWVMAMLTSRLEEPRLSPQLHVRLRPTRAALATPPPAIAQRTLPLRLHPLRLGTGAQPTGASLRRRGGPPTLRGFARRRLGHGVPAGALHSPPAGGRAVTAVVHRFCGRTATIVGVSSAFVAAVRGRPCCLGGASVRADSAPTITVAATIARVVSQLGRVHGLASATFGVTSTVSHGSARADATPRGSPVSCRSAPRPRAIHSARRPLAGLACTHRAGACGTSPARTSGTRGSERTTAAGCYSPRGPARRQRCADIGAA